MAIELSIEPFEKAIVTLEVALDRYRQDETDDLIRDACIQRFEFTYELAHKMLKRFLEATSPNPDEFDGQTFQDLIRMGNERGLLRSDWTLWKEYRRARGTTSHTYDEAKAREVFAVVPDFLLEARFLRDRLQEELA